MNILFLLLSALLIAVDYFIKLWAQNVLQPMGPKEIIPNVLSLVYHENFGAAWGIMQGKRGLLLIVTSLMIGIFIFFLISGRVKNWLARTSISLIIAGGIGNLIDRAFNEGGFVVDYIYFEPINFPIFNFADCCIVVGTILLMIYIIFIEEKGAKKRKKDIPWPLR